MGTMDRNASADTVTYDAFISYSHAADGLLAPRLQAGLQRFAKPWWRRRALRVFGTVSLSTDDLIQRTRENLRRTFTD